MFAGFLTLLQPLLPERVGVDDVGPAAAADDIADVRRVDEFLQEKVLFVIFDFFRPYRRIVLDEEDFIVPQAPGFFSRKQGTFPNRRRSS